MQEIAAASAEQSSGVRQMNTAMTQMSKITQQNASSSEQLAATAEEMAAQTAQLQQLMELLHHSPHEARRQRPAGRPRWFAPGRPIPPAETRQVRRGCETCRPARRRFDDSKFGRF